MLLWNYLITPIYLGYPREAVVKLLIPAFLPFNLLKGGLNASIVMLIYKPLSKALHSANLMPRVVETCTNRKKVTIWSVLVSSLIIVSCILSILAFRGIIWQYKPKHPTTRIQDTRPGSKIQPFDLRCEYATICWIFAKTGVIFRNSLLVRNPIRWRYIN